MYTGIMEISRPTFTRLILSARTKVASMIVLGNELEIEGGNIHFKENVYECNDCKTIFSAKMGIRIQNCPDCDCTIDSCA